MESKESHEKTLQWRSVRILSKIKSGIFATKFKNFRKLIKISTFSKISAWGSVWKEWYENGNMGTIGEIPRNKHQNLSKNQWKIQK